MFPPEMTLLDWAVLAVRQAADEGGAAVPHPTGENRAPTLYGFMGAFAPLALIAVVLRFYTRIRFAKLGWDDITIAMGMVLYTGLIIATVEGKRVLIWTHRNVRLTTAAMKYGLGVHIWEVRRETEQQMQKVGPYSHTPPGPAADLRSAASPRKSCTLRRWASSNCPSSSSSSASCRPTTTGGSPSTA